MKTITKNILCCPFWFSHYLFPQLNYCCREELTGSSGAVLQLLENAAANQPLVVLALAQLLQWLQLLQLQQQFLTVDLVVVAITPTPSTCTYSYTYA